MTRVRLYDQKPEPHRCYSCGKLTDQPDGYCSVKCKEDAQARIFGAPLRTLPVVGLGWLRWREMKGRLK